MAKADPPVGWVRLVSEDPHMEVSARLWEERPDVEAGYGGWEEVPRPRRKPITTWRGRPGLRVSLPILLNRFVSGRSIEPEIAMIEKMGGLVMASDGEPPRVKVQAQGAAVPHTSLTWIVDGLEWGDALMNQYGNRTRQQVTLHLLEYTTDVYLRDRSAANRKRDQAARRKKGRGARSKRIVAKRSVRKRRAGAAYLFNEGNARAVDSYEFGAGESLVEIAARELGDANRWPEIAALNGLRDPQAIAPGQVIRLP